MSNAATGKLAGAGARAAAATKPAESSRVNAGALAAALGSRPGIDIVIPRTQIAGWMTLVGRADTSRVRADTRRHFLEAGYSEGALIALSSELLHDWNAELAVRTLAISVRDPADHGKPLDALESWRAEVDDEQIAALWRMHQDLVEREDPIGADTLQLTETEISQLQSAAKKKAFDLLTSFGSRKLALFVTSLVEQPAS